MRIIGAADKEEYICVLSAEEIAHITGVGSQYSLGAGKPAVGCVIKVSRIYADATEILDAYKGIKRELTSIQNRAAKLLALMRPEKKEIED
jgi:hypothetical protein